ncbi:ATP-binding protein [Flavobacterium sp. SUN052]|uniref:sensor histidine kinase n=1 Tax=Flavobacterium sp. SUN052 TaxID=3002441 RepID=UPI00237E6E4D|nr:ATP-binding protein [Flavobacterium sp. SUN052]MEC4003995.1 ATP-binding protein [Flavobacterium sp. SUN052]
MNSLLKRQIAKLIKPELLRDLKVFLKSVNDSYENFEDQLNMSQRAMKISSDELFEANKKLREEAASLKEVNKNLSDILSSMNLDASKLADEKDFNPTEYFKKQAAEIVIINNQREELLKSLEINNQELNEYAHVVSHDLKAPLRNVDTLINWILEDNKENFDEHTVNSLNQVLFNVEKMDLLIKGILDYSTIDKLESEDRLVDFNQLVDEIKRTLLIPNTIEIRINTDLPKIYGNAWRFKQVLQNLIQNAINYNDKENGLVEIGVSDKDSQFEFYIKDNGIGIAELYHDRIFKVFTKLESKGQSSGIGLSIVKKIIHFYKGKIWLESQENRGTTFFFTLPKHNGTT